MSNSAVSGPELTLANNQIIPLLRPCRYLLVNTPPVKVRVVFTFMKALRKLDHEHDIPVIVVTVKDPGTSEVHELNEDVEQILLIVACDMNELDRNQVQMVINVKIKR